MSNTENPNFAIRQGGIQLPGTVGVRASMPSLLSLEQSPRVQTEEALTEARNQEISELYETCYEPISEYMAKRAHVDQVDELTSDVFLKACQSWGSYKDINKTRRHWLFGIARHVVATYYRDREREHQIHQTELPEEISDGSRHQVSAHSQLEVKETLSELPDHYRNVLRLLEMGFNDKEVAQALGMNDSAFRSLKLRARRRFLEQHTKIDPELTDTSVA